MIMAASFERQKAAVKTRIQSSANVDDLTVLLNKMNFADLQSMLEDYVDNQSSPDKMARLFYGSESLPDVIGTDCTKYMLEFLEEDERSKISRASKTINESCKLIQQRSSNPPLPLQSPGYIATNSFSAQSTFYLIGYNVENKYDLDQWNSIFGDKS